MASAARIAANRANAQKSTGPKSPEGKARSAQNALKHGMCALSPTIPGENPLDLLHKRRQWEASVRPRNDAERNAVKSAVEASHRRDRCLRAEDARLAKAARAAPLAYDLEQARRARDLGKLLLEDPIGCYAMDPTTPEAVAAFRAFRERDPALVVAELRTFAAGAAFLIDRLTALHEVLLRDGFWVEEQMYAALRLMGLRPEDAIDDLRVAQAYMACQALHPEPMTFNTMALLACLGRLHRPVYSERTDPLEEDLKVARKTALDRLSAMALQEIEQLKTHKATALDANDRLDREEAPLRALCDDSKEAALQVRYERERGLDLHRALTALVALKKLDVEAATLPPLEAPGEGATPEPAATSAPAAPPRNEASDKRPAGRLKPSRRARKALREHALLPKSWSQVVAHRSPPPRQGKVPDTWRADRPPQPSYDPRDNPQPPRNW